MTDTYYLTKYALTSGVIYKVQCNHPPSGLGYITPMDRWQSYKIGSAAFADPSAAMKRAEAARTKKIDGLRKQIAALEKLTFTVEESNG